MESVSKKKKENFGKSSQRGDINSNNISRYTPTFKISQKFTKKTFFARQVHIGADTGAGASRGAGAAALEGTGTGTGVGSGVSMREDADGVAYADSGAVAGAAHCPIGV